jgi:thiol-disulfide isomerase/thioredoxin
MRIHLVVILTLLLGACSESTQETNPLTALRGQWVVVNYWAKWCKPCIEEIPELNRLDADHDGISVVGVNFDGLTGEALANQEQELGVAFPTIGDPGAQLGTGRPSVLPTSVILNPRGEVHRTLVGPQTRDTLLEAMGTSDAGG